MTAAKMALQGMVPNVYQEWELSTRRWTALAKQGLDADSILQKVQREKEEGKQ